MSSPVQSRFLPAGRADADRLRAQAARLATSPVVAAIFQAASGAVAIVNEHRQVVALDAAALELIGEGAGEALGLRPGEALGCTRAADGPDGCGTGAACASCGAALAMIVAEHVGRPEERDCAITIRREGRRVDVDLRVRAAPLELDGERFLLLSVTDVSAERRRQALERSFAGDVLRQMADLRAAAAGLADARPAPEAIARVRRLVQQLDRALQLERALSAGIGGGLEPVSRTISIASELTVLAESVERSPVSRGRKLELSAPSPAEMMAVDPTLLQHVLVAMTLNALEATRAGRTVRVWVEIATALVSFRVWNEAAIPAAVVHRIFQRYFTTRGAGRGSGTWSMKVVGEELLRGEVGFRTSATSGTTFWLTLPRHPFAVA